MAPVSDPIVSPQAERVRALFETLPLQVWSFTATLCYGVVNPAHAVFTGHTPGELTDADPRVCHGTDLAERWRRAARLACARYRAEFADVWLPDALGELRLLRITAYPQWSDSSTVESVICTAEDITESVRATGGEHGPGRATEAIPGVSAPLENESATRERPLRGLVHELTARFVEIDSDGIDGAIDQALETLGCFSGVDRAYVFQYRDDWDAVDNTHEWCAPGIEPQRDLLQGMPRDEAPWIQDRLRQGETVIIHDVERLPLEADRDRRVLEAQSIRSIVLVPMRLGSRALGFLGLDAVKTPRHFDAEDASLLRLISSRMAHLIERRRTALALRASEDQFRAIFEHAAEGILVVDGQTGRLTNANPAICQLLGYAKEELLGLHDTDFGPKLGRNGMAELARVRPDDDPLRSLSYRRRDGTTREVDVRASEIQLAEGTHRVLLVSDRTEARRSQRALEQERARYRRLLDHMPILIAHFDTTPSVHFVNRAFEETFGWATEELNRVDLLSEVYPDPVERARVMAYMRHAGPDWQIFEPRARSGELIPSEWCTVSLDDGTRVSIGIDIRARQRAEQTERTLSALVEQSADSMLYTDAAFRIRYINRAFEALYGWSPDELIGHTPDFLNAEPEASRIQNAIYQTVTRGRSFSGEGLNYRRDGRTFYCQYKVSPLLGEAGSIIGYMGSQRDVTEHRAAEEALRASEARLQTILNSVDRIPIQGYNAERQVIFWNRASETLYGFSAEEALGRPIEDLIIRPEDTATFKAAIDGWLTRGSSIPPGELELRDKHGNPITVYSSHAMVRNGAGEPEFYCVDVDLTEKKRADREIERMQRLESLGTVAGGIAHDFNNLLSGLLSIVDLAEAGESTTGIAPSDSLQEARRIVEQARGLTQQLLTFAKGGNPIFEAVNTAELIRETVAFHLHGSNVVSAFHLPEAIWPVQADKDQLAQVVANLTLNARQAMAGGGVLRVAAWNGEATATTDARDPGWVEIRFDDQGVGMDASQIERIFEPYYTTKEQGTGLGLAVVHSIVTQHGGTIAVESTPGVGTTVILHLRAVQAPAPAAAEMTEQTGETRPLQILLVDDEAMIRRWGARMLERLGHEVQAVGDGSEAVSAYRTRFESGNTFDVVIMDLTLPGGLSGQHVTQELLAIDPKARVIVSSGYAEDARPVATPAAFGFVGRLNKPYRLNELGAAIQAAMQAAVPAANPGD